MARFSKLTGLGIMLAALAACAAPDPFAVQAVPRGEQLDIRHILGAHPNKRACVAYQAATNSCAAIITSTVEGNTLISREMTALQVAGSTSVQNIEIVTRRTLEGEQACARPEDVNVTGRDEMSEFMVGEARALIADYGGRTCATYYRSGDGYVVSMMGDNGELVPPGDVEFQFITGAAGLRAQ